MVREEREGRMRELKRSSLLEIVNALCLRFSYRLGEADAARPFLMARTN